MSELEATISKYLDGELSPAELAQLRRELASNPEALEIYREMSAIRLAARRAPAMRRPSASTEARLFHQLQLEGLHGRPTPAASASASASAMPRHRRALATAAALLIVTIAGIASLLSIRPDAAQSPVASSGVAVETPAAIEAPRELAAQAPSGASSPRIAVGRRVPTTSSPAHAATRRSAIEESRDLRHAAPTTEPTNEPNGVTNDTSSASPDEGRVPSNHNDRDALPFAANTDSETAPAPAMLPMPESGRREALLSAGLRYGPTYFDRASDESAEELIAALDVNLGDGHRIAFMGGRSAAVTEQRAVNTGAVPARAAMSGGKRSDEGLLQVNESPEPYDLEIEKEWWAGIGYNYSFRVSSVVEVGAGVRGGIGARSLRAGADVTLRLKATERIAIELGPTATHVVPHTSGHNEYSIESASDGYLYEAESEHTSFSTYGATVGIRIALD